jgi:predicted nucleotidyltransferase
VTAAGSDDVAAALTAALTELPEVELAYLFGSHAGGRARAESDVDVGVLVSPEAHARSDAALRRLIEGWGAWWGAIAWISYS